MKAALRHDKRGVSPIYATVLLIGITIALAVLVFNSTILQFGGLTKGVQKEISSSVLVNFDIRSAVQTRDTLRILVENTDNQRLEGFNVVIYYGNTQVVQRSPQQVNPFETAFIELPINITDNITKVSLIPITQQQNNNLIHTQSTVTTINIQYNIVTIDTDADGCIDSIDYAINISCPRSTCSISNIRKGCTSICQEITCSGNKICSGGSCVQKQGQQNTVTRTIDCPRCGQHKAPPLTQVNVTLDLTGQGELLEDTIPSSWIISQTNGGLITPLNQTYNKIIWNISRLQNPTVSYLVVSPQKTTPSTKYIFASNLDQIDLDSYDIIVADPTTTCNSCATCTSAANTPGDTVQLSSDLLVGVGADPCINIVADNITLDCNGYNIADPNFNGFTAISINNRNNITIKNCVIDKINAGIYLTNSANINIKESNISAYSTTVEIFGVNNLTVQNSIFNSSLGTGYSSYNFYISASNNITIKNSKFITGTTPAVYSDGSNRLQFINNLINQTDKHNNFVYGLLYILSSNETLINNNTIITNSFSYDIPQIFVQGSNFTYIYNNNLTNAKQAINSYNNASIYITNLSGIVGSQKKSYYTFIENNTIYSIGNRTAIIFENSVNGIINNINLTTIGQEGAIIKVLNSNNISLYNSSLINIGDFKDAVYLKDSINNTILYNTIYTYGNFSHAINLTSSNYTNINNNIISSSGFNSSTSIYLISGLYNQITNNNIINIGSISSHAIRLEDNSNNNIIGGNNISVAGFNSWGISIPNPTGATNYNQKFNEIISNIIKTTGNNGYGIYLESAINNTLTNNTINTTGNSAYGIFIDVSANYNTFSNDTILTSGDTARGILISSTDGNKLFGMNIKTTNINAPAIYLKGNTGNINFTMFDSVLNATNPTITDIFIFNSIPGGEWNLTNVTFTDKTRNPGIDGKLNIKWYLGLYVNYTNGTAVSGANVTIRDKNDLLVFSGFTNPSGFVNRTNLIEYTDNISGQIFPSNYTVYAEINPSGQRQINLSTNTNTFITLQPSFVDCGTLSTPNTLYTLEQNVSSAGTCFNIVADNVTLDCGGYTITYATSPTGGYGINSTNTNGNINTTIKNCNIIEGSSNNAADQRAISFRGITNGTIFNNTIKTSTAGPDVANAIVLFSPSIKSSSNKISNNKINVAGSTGILVSYSDYNILNNNTIITSGTSDYGIQLSTESYYNIVRNNNVTSSSTSGIGIGVITSGTTSFNNIIGNSIKSSGGAGIRLSAVTNNLFANNTILTTGTSSTGILMEGEQNNNTFLSMDVKTQGSLANAIHIVGNYINFTFFDSLLNAINAYDIYIENTNKNGEFNFTNVTFANKTRQVGANGTLNVHWYLDTYVNDFGGSAVNSAFVQVRDKFNRFIYGGLTNNQGIIPTLTLLEYSQNSSTLTHFTNYTVYANRNTTVQNQINLTTNKQNTLILPPGFNLKIDFDDSGYQNTEPGFISLNLTPFNLGRYNSQRGYGYNDTLQVDSRIRNVLTSDLFIDRHGATVDKSNKILIIDVPYKGEFYNVTIFSGDFAPGSVDEMQVYAKNQLMLNLTNTSAGTIRNASFILNVTDTQLNLTFSSAGPSSQAKWKINGIIISNSTEPKISNAQIKTVELTDTGIYNDCINTICSLTPVRNSTVINMQTRVTAYDPQGCSLATHNVILYLCTLEHNSTNKCNPNIANFTYQLDKLDMDLSGTICNFTFITPKGPQGTPQFYLASRNYTLYVNLTKGSKETTLETNSTYRWFYQRLISVAFLNSSKDETDSIKLGDNIIELGQFNPGIFEYNISNWGNVEVNLTFNATDPTNIAVPSLLWNLTTYPNGFILDDEALATYPDTLLPSINLTYVQQTFGFGNGLRRCQTIGCNSLVNETLSTYFHIRPPFGLTPGTYNSLIFVVVRPNE